MVKSLYIHIPFCDSICDYCDFTKLQYFRMFAEKYLISLEKELNETVLNKELETIYIGGGTPTSLEDDLFEKLLKMIEPYSSKATEYTCEANPESLTLNKIKLLKKYKVNRVSIGVESTNDKILRAINRKHTFENAINCIDLLKEEGIDNFNLDLIIGLPNVSFNMFKQDLENISSLKPNHISIYSLTVHPHTVFSINQIEEPSEDLSRDFYDYAHYFLLEKGFKHYEVSNFALPNKQSKHNYCYWKNDEYYGIGLGASGYVGNVRYKNTTSLNKYINNDFAREEEIVDAKDLMEYQIMLNLRTETGIDLIEFKERFGFDLLENKGKLINQYMDEKLLFIKDNHLICTYEGMMVLDQIIIDLI